MASNIPAAFLRGASPEEALAALAEEAEAAADATAAEARASADVADAKRKETKASKGLAETLQKSFGSALASGPGGLLKAGIGGGVNALFTSNSTFGQGFTETLVRGAAGAVGANALELAAVDEATARVGAFLRPSAELGFQPSGDDLEALVRQELPFTLGGADLQKGLNTVNRQLALEVGANSIGGALDAMSAAGGAVAKAAADLKAAFEAGGLPFQGGGSGN